MDDFIGGLKQKKFKGEIDNSQQTLEFYSHDASLFELKPQLVVFPKDTADLEALVATAGQLKSTMPHLSLTARSAGTCMSGGAINDSVVVDINRHFNKIESVSEYTAHAQPGVFYRDFEKASLRKGGLLPSFPASRELATIGGMVANNSGGEKSLQYGKTEDYVTELEVVLADGKKHTVKPLTRRELVVKMAQKDFDGKLFSHMYKLLA